MAYFHIYATANDDKSFSQDIANLWSLAKRKPGVPQVKLRIAISEVHPVRCLDRIFVKHVTSMFEKTPWIELDGITFKSNVGRDFSSFAVAYRLIAPEPDDYVFFQNRSGFGPRCDDWYSTYLQQYSKDSHIALCGTTINFSDHPFRSKHQNLPHVQTYAFLTQHKRINQFREDFPGEHEEERINTILNGEIGLSQKLIKQGLAITSLERPDLTIRKQDSDTYETPRYSIIENALETHPFLHRRWFNARARSLSIRRFQSPIRRVAGALDCILS